MSDAAALRNAEESTVEGGRETGDGGEVSDIRRTESLEDSTFVSNVTGRGDKDGKGSKKKSSGSVIKKYGPLIAIFILLIGFAIVLIFSQVAMPMAIANRLIEEYNTNGISAVLRADNILDIQLSLPAHSTFGFGDEQLESFKLQNILPIEVTSETGGSGVALAYETKVKNAWNVVVGTGMSPNVTDVRNKLVTNYPDYNFYRVTIINFKDAMEDGYFKKPYTAASKTWRGGNSGWYDSLADLAEQVNGYTRSRWVNFKVRSANKGVKAFFKSLAKSGLEEASNGSMRDVTTYHIDKSPDGEGIEVPDVDKTKVTNKALSYKAIYDTFFNVASKAASLTCSAVEGFMAVQTLVSTYQRIESINFGAGLLESIQSVQAGDSDGEPMRQYMENITKTDPETNTNAVSSSQGMPALFSGTPIDSNNSSVLSANVEKSLTNIYSSSDGDIMALFSEIVGSGTGILAAYSACNYVKGGLAIANMALTIASFIPIIGQGLKVVQISFKAVAKAVVVGLVEAAAGIVARKLISYYGKKLLASLATDLVGDVLGEEVVSSGNKLLQVNHQMGGGSSGDSYKLGVFKSAQDKVIAEEAEYQRSIRSPFDITSQYTFLGSIVYSLIPMANSVGVGPVLKNISSLMSNSVSSLLPSASAIAETNMVGVAKTGDCPMLESIHIKGDAYCNPLYMTDTATISGSVSRTPSDILQIEKGWGQIDLQEDAGGNYTVKVLDNTDLSRYITYCGQRVSSWGIADANIASALSPKNSTTSRILSAIPILGDVMDIVTAAKDKDNLPWTTGSACVASEDNPYWCQNQIHQRFIEDQRFFENTGGIKKNSVTAYLEEYYEKNPLDYSIEGILARYSGMTKEDVIATIGFANGLIFLAEYQPEERYAFGGEQKPEKGIQFEQTEEVIIATEPKYIIYNTLREKTTTA